MAIKDRNWIRDILIIPLIVGLIIVIIQFVLPYLLKKDKEVSYEIPLSTTFINKDEIKDVEIKIYVENNETKFINIFKARVWNSGDLPLKNIPISYIFNPYKDYSDIFQIFSINHETKPKYQFGKISKLTDDKTQKAFKYELLNPGDEIEVTFIANAPAFLSIYSKSEGMKVKRVSSTSRRDWLQYTTVIIAMLASLLSLLLKSFDKLKFNIIELFKKSRD